MELKKYLYQVISAFIVGLIFGVGLIISGMTQPQKVIGFLDLLGSWDPSLMFVMLAAIPVHFISYRLIAKMPSPILDWKWHYPTKKEITKPLVIGSILFGFGWGVGGYCPGPALVALGSGALNVIVFLISMTIGMWFFGFLNKRIKFNR
ncbi:MAG: YeeE/YedE family protein [Bdellovibrionaceae bacterium]|nr:YeeE/YedE family protein [Pseudobdellovibrionaceae bacterium]